MSRALKVAAELTLTPAREELRFAILEVEAAEATAAKATAAVEVASDQMRIARLAYSKAEDAFSEVTSPPRSLQDKLREAFDVDDQMRIAEEHYNAPPRAPVTASALAKLRAAVESAGDDVTAAELFLDAVRAQAAPKTSALNRAKARRQQAIYEVVRPEVSRLTSEVEAATETLVAKRAALNFVSSELIDWSWDERRQAAFCLTRVAPFPEEQGLRTDSDLSKRDAAIASWQGFAEAITQDARAQFPSS